MVSARGEHLITSRTEELAASYVDGHSLPQDFYVADDVFELDTERIFAGNWLFVGSAAELAQPGDVLAWSVGRDSGKP